MRRPGKPRADLWGAAPFPAELEEWLHPRARRRCYDRWPVPIPDEEETMSDVDARFTQAQQDVTQLPERPGNLTLLRLYALFKQATQGDAHGERPGMTDIVGKYKYDSWAALRGMAQDAARQQYVELVESLKNGTGA
jgi:acyl-CoA-binding protein